MEFLWFLENFRGSVTNKVMQFITYFGQDILIIVAICVLYWCIDKEFAYIVGFNYFISGLLVQTLKITFRIPRPWSLDSNFKAVDSAISGATGYSFPSGHTQGATSFFFSLALRLKRKALKILCVLAFLLVGLSRMFLGVHTPKDVLTAMGVSIIVAALLWRFRKPLLDKKNTLPVAIALMLIALVVLIYAVILINRSVVDFDNGLDAVKASGAGIGFSLGFVLERKTLNFSVKCRHIYSQIIKLILGLAGAFLSKELFSVVFGDTVLGAALEYFFLVLWVLYLYPLIFQKFSNLKDR